MKKSIKLKDLINSIVNFLCLIIKIFEPVKKKVEYEILMKLKSKYFEKIFESSHYFTTLKNYLQLN